MSLLRAASRALAPSSSSSLTQTSLPALLSRAYSTEPAAPTEDVHRAQRAARPRSLRQVSEQSGATGKLIALAVNNTVQGSEQQQQQGARAPRQRFQGQRQGQNRAPQQQQQQQEGGAPRPPRTPRQRSSPSTVDTALLDGEAASGDASAPRPAGQRRPQRRSNDGPRTNLGSALSSRRSTSSPEASALREAGGAFRPRGAAAGPGGDRKPRNPLRPKQPRPARKPRASAFAPEDVKPLEVPSTVRTPSANLARLLRADLARKTLQVKAAVGEKAVNEDAETAEEREAARKILGGDYSIWTEAGKDVSKGAKGKEQQLEHARGILKLNPSVGIVGRETLLNKVKEALL
ncbi:hypothetical protein JCM6882_005357 [Rhodosporidiobolus microsporus]